MYEHHTSGLWVSMTRHLTSNVGHYLRLWITIWYMNTIPWYYESVWPDVWPKNKCRSVWPIFHGPVILPYILKTVWCMNIILQDYESVWPDIWPQSKCRSLFEIMNQYDLMHDLKINVGHCDLYFMVQWFCVIPWRLFDVWTSSLRIMGQYDQTFDLKINVSLWPIFYGSLILPYISKTLRWMICHFFR